MKLSEAILAGIELSRPTWGSYYAPPLSSDPDRRPFACALGAAGLGAGIEDVGFTALALEFPDIAQRLDKDGNRLPCPQIAGLDLWDWITTTNDRLCVQNNASEHGPAGALDPRPWIAHELAEAGF